MDEPAARAAWSELTALVEASGVFLRESWTDGSEVEGVFHPHLFNRPSIEVTTPRKHLVWVDGHQEWKPPLDELVNAVATLAHEFGHYLSWHADEDAWKVVHAACVQRHNLTALGASVIDGMSLDDRTLIYNEEERAWRFGREQVPEAMWSFYDARAEENLAAYREALGIA